jgi:hypothetical protein
MGRPDPPGQSSFPCSSFSIDLFLLQGAGGEASGRRRPRLR